MIHVAHDTRSLQITSVAFSRGDGGMRLLTNSRDNSLKLIDARTYEVIGVMQHDRYRTAYNWSDACFSPDSQYVAAGSGDGTIFVWETLGQSLVAELKSHR
jgi:autophagy-related protein 16